LSHKQRRPGGFVVSFQTLPDHFHPINMSAAGIGSVFSISL
jgi:hypothetical protein